MSDDPALEVRAGGDRFDDLFKTYRNGPTYRLAQVSVLVLPLLFLVLVFLAPDLDLASVLGLAAICVGGAIFVWLFYGRPRLVVAESGVAVVGSLGVRRLAWHEIQRFDCQQYLMIKPVSGNRIHVLGLPAPGVQRVLHGHPGAVDELATRLNQHVASVTGHRDREPVSIGSVRGRRDIRLMAALSTVGGLLIGFASWYIATRA